MEMHELSLLLKNLRFELQGWSSSTRTRTLAVAYDYECMYCRPLTQCEAVTRTQMVYRPCSSKLP